MDTLVFILKILGALGVFLYGMKVMSEGIQRTAGDRMRRIMAKMTHNRFAGAVTGLVTTGLLQSSSATTVMVVSFVNAGLLTLVESIGVIMGANLGTTLTAWIIAMIGKFSLSTIAVPIIGLGLPIFFVGKGRIKSFGETLIGFGLLFYGLYLLKETVPDVKGMLASTDPVLKAQAEGIKNFIDAISGHGYGTIVIFLFFGIILTLIVQSSSAAMAITVTLAIQGWIGFEESAAIVLGENIGTTVTAWLASIGTSVNARRSARAHFMFNVIGVIWMMILFFPFLGFVELLSSQLPESFRITKLNTEIGFKLAIFHSLFNFANIFALIWFVPQIARIVTKWIPETESKNHTHPRLKFISQGMVDLGELNIPEAEKATLELAEITRSMFNGYLDIFRQPETDLSEQVKRLKEQEDETDVLTHDITEYLVRTSAAEISDRNAIVVARMIRVVGELEEVGDAIYRLVQITKRKYEKNRDFTDEITKSILAFSSKVNRMIDLYIGSIDIEDAQRNHDLAQTLRKEIRSKKKSLIKSATQRMKEDSGNVKAELLTIDMINQFEMIGSLGLNIVQTSHLDEFEDEADQ